MILGIEDTFSYIVPDVCYTKQYKQYCENIALSLAASLVWAILAGIGIYFIRLLYRRTARTRKIFLSLPMAGLVTRNDFDVHRKFAMELTRELERAERVKVFCGYTSVVSFEEWENNPATAAEILSRIRRCDYYVAILTDRVYSSVLCEIGYALARNKRVTVFYRLYDEGGKSLSTLPYLLVRLDSNWKLGVRLNKYTFNTLDEILKDARGDPAGFLNANSRIESRARDGG